MKTRTCENPIVGLFAVSVLAVRSAVRRLFAVLKQILDAVLIDEKVRTAVTSEFDAIAVIPFDGAVEHFAIG